MLIKINMLPNKNVMRMQAIIIKKMAIKEQDELVICYTRDVGKQRYRAKSSLLPKSKQGPHLQVLNFIDFSLVEGNGHAIITSAYSVEAFCDLKSSLRGMAVALFFLECFDKLIFDNEPDVYLWDFLYNTLTHFNKLAKDPQTNWREVMKDKYQELMEVMGYKQGTYVHDLHHTQFSSPHFIDNVLK